LREVYQRSGDQPFARLDDIITQQEMTAITDHYRQMTS
jgi:hypothetical protein